MGKIHQALEKSKTDRQDPETNLQQPTRKVGSDNSFTKEPANDRSMVGKTDANLRARKTSLPNTGRMSPDLICALKQYSVEAEQFRNLKNNILFPEKGEPPRTIMVTSTAPGDGKSFVASNLALSIAQSIDEYVLLMDCDLRSPSIESMFGFQDTDGLSEYLTHGKPIKSLLLNTQINKLKILSAGHPPNNPSELLSSEQMRRLLYEVKLRYNDRYVVLDTPPPYVTSETSALARQVDGIVLVVRQRRSRIQDIHDVIDIYGRKKILGIVYNDSQKMFSHGYGKYGYGKYHYGT